MSEENNVKNTMKRWVGKVRRMVQSNGPYEKIYLDNTNTNNKDGSPNTYYKGSLIWFDQETGKSFLIKQLGFSLPKDGLKADQVQKGFLTCVTIDLSNAYEAEELP